MIYYIAQIALENSWWLVKQTYNLGHYAVYGHQETIEEKLLKQIEEMRKQQEDEKKQIEELKNNMYVLYYQGINKKFIEN